MRHVRVMDSATPVWDQMAPADLPAVEAIAEIVHPAYPEDPAIFVERLALYPAGCRVLRHEGRVCGYLISHPAVTTSPPKLGRLLGALPAQPDCYYLHDLALAPASQGGGQAAAVVAWVIHHARAVGFDRMALIALRAAVPYWLRHGFVAIPEPAPGILASYNDPDARFMVRGL